MKQTFEKALVEQCAPTLAGMKPASLFRIGDTNTSLIRQWAEAWDQRLQPLGIRLLVLKECFRTNACMVYLYRERWLEEILMEPDNWRFLHQVGYETQDIVGALSQLSQRLCLEQEYPHEIGVFLGYPLSDVIGFIENQGRNYTCCGYWKSYGDPEAAKQCFDRYRTCTSTYKRMYGNGTPIIQLVVAA